jgi:hypothetical protein
MSKSHVPWLAGTRQPGRNHGLCREQLALLVSSVWLAVCHHSLHSSRLFSSLHHSFLPLAVVDLEACIL